MYTLAICDNSSILNTILLIKNIINIIFLVVPIILVLFLTVDLTKNVFAIDDKDNDKNLKTCIKRIIYSVILMFVPLIVETFMGMISNYSKVAECYDIATEETVQEFLAKEDNEYQEAKAKKEEEQEARKAEVEQENQAAAKATKEAEQNAKEREDNNNDTSSTTQNNSTTTATGEKIASTAEKIAWPKGTPVSTYKSKPYANSYSLAKKYDVSTIYDCGQFAKLVWRVSLDSKKMPNPLNIMLKNRTSQSKLNNAVSKYGFKAIKWDGKLKSLQRGDIITYKKPGDTSSGAGQHAMIYLGTNSSGRPMVAEGARGRHYYGHISVKTANKGQFKLGNYAYYYIIRSK